MIIKGNYIEGCGTGISVPHDYAGEIDSNIFKNTLTAIEVRNAPNFLESIGLRTDTPPELLLDVINGLKGSTDKTDAERIVRQHGIFDWINSAGAIGSVTGALATISSNPDLMSKICALFS